MALCTCGRIVEDGRPRCPACGKIVSWISWLRSLFTKVPARVDAAVIPVVSHAGQTAAPPDQVDCHGAAPQATASHCHVERKVYTSLEELPEGLRRRVEAQLSGSEVGALLTQRVEVVTKKIPMSEMDPGLARRLLDTLDKVPHDVSLSQVTTTSTGTTSIRREEVAMSADEIPEALRNRLADSIRTGDWSGLVIRDDELPPAVREKMKHRHPPHT